MVLQATRENSLRSQTRLLHSQPGPGALLQAAVDPLVSIATLAATVSAEWCAVVRAVVIGVHYRGAIKT